MNFCNHSRHLNIKALIVAFYFSIVWASFFYLNITPNKKVNVVIFLLILVLSYFAARPLMQRLRLLELNPVALSRKMRVLIFIASAFITMLCMALWIVAYYPGSFSPDSLKQYAQALTGTYNDWHPVWHTLIIFTLPLKLFGTPASIIICQSAYFSLVFGYAILTTYEIAGKRAALCVLLFVLLNPYVESIVLYPWKDVIFAIAALFCTVFLIRLKVLPSSEKQTWKLLVFGVVLGFATIFRHNAILYTAPLLIVLFLNADKKAFLTAVAITLATIFIIKVPIYGLLNVEQPSNRTEESTGLSMTIIGNVAKESPDLMDEELSQFAFSAASKEQWEEKYQCGSYNSIKFQDVINGSVIEEQGVLGMMRLTVKCFKESPNASLDAFITLTSQVYGFESSADVAALPTIEKNNFNIQYRQTPGPFETSLKTLIDSYNSFVQNSIFKYFKTYGFWLFALLLVFLSKLDARSSESWKKTSLVFPILIYDFGTMLLLSGSDARFFFITFLVIPLLIVYLLLEEKRVSKTESFEAKAVEVFFHASRNQL